MYFLYLQLDNSQLLKLKHSCSTRRNFAWKQADLMFTKLMSRNFPPTTLAPKEKNQLDKKKLDTIKRHVLQYWPPDGTENEEAIWKGCIKAIDEGGRALKTKIKRQGRFCLGDISNTSC